MANECRKALLFLLGEWRQFPPTSRNSSLVPGTQHWQIARLVMFLPVRLCGTCTVTSPPSSSQPSRALSNFHCRKPSPAHVTKSPSLWSAILTSDFLYLTRISVGSSKPHEYSLLILINLILSVWSKTRIFTVWITKQALERRHSNLSSITQLLSAELQLEGRQSLHAGLVPSSSQTCLSPWTSPVIPPVMPPLCLHA